MRTLTLGRTGVWEEISIVVVTFITVAVFNTSDTAESGGPTEFGPSSGSREHPPLVLYGSKVSAVGMHLPASGHRPVCGGGAAWVDTGLGPQFA